VEETAKRFKALERTREAGTAQDYGSVVPVLILGVKTQFMKLTLIESRAGFVLELRPFLLSSPQKSCDVAPAGNRIRNTLRGYLLSRTLQE
jgi:hypothetical protein